ncbi:hypothetical protein Glove_40g169 [Diversispora epigaea]|uniref:alpha,alpha-trehalase n=1 Tax=Diversispora epigaea TaxID=1348612 RepID=A0A397JFT5_9GLOM|nr:hypothetical protein Glove_40g169 [Diversispora epigaea]
MNEITLSEFSEKIGEEKMIGTFKNAAKKRLEGIMDLFWDDELESFMDYNISSESRSEVFSLASYFPFWAESLPKDFTTNFTTILDTYSYITGLLSEFPGSPPTTHILIQKDDDESENKEFIMNLIKDLSQRYVDSVLCAWYSTGGSIPGFLNKLSGVGDTGHIFEKYDTQELGLPGGGGGVGDTGHIFEKYDTQELGLPGGGGEYDVQVGFGWTNGILLWIFSNFGDILEEPECLSDLT